MTVKAPFQPAAAGGQAVSPGAAAATITTGRGNKQICLTNTGANICYVRTGFTGSVIAASTTAYPVLPNSQVVISKDQDHDVLSHISASGTTLSVVPGDGW